MVIGTNIEAQISADNLRATQARLSKSLARLSSGSKIVSPADDAAGLAVATGFDDQVRRTDAARKNIGNALSFLQTQDGYLQHISKALNRMSELAVLALDGTKTNTDLALYQAEFTQLDHYMAQVGKKDFNGVSLFSADALSVTIDPEGAVLSMSGIDLTAGGYAGVADSLITNVASTRVTLAEMKIAIEQLAVDRARLGAYQTRLNYTAEQLEVSKQNLTAARSRIQDVDVAEESTEYAKENILVQSGTAMLAQANQMPRAVLKLLQ
jgi:flagellin